MQLKNLLFFASPRDANEIFAEKNFSWKINCIFQGKMGSAGAKIPLKTCIVNFAS